MTDDLRTQLAQTVREHQQDGWIELPVEQGTAEVECTPRCGCGAVVVDHPAHVSDALLARYAIAGPLPEPDETYAYAPTAARWIVYPSEPSVYLSSEGQIERGGHCYWSTRKGDDPLPFAAALIAAYGKAQEQTHE